MHSHFQQDFILKNQPVTIFFDPEPFGTAAYYHLKFRLPSGDKHLVMKRSKDDDWELENEDPYFKLFEVQFSHAIRIRNSTVDNL